MQSRHPHEKLYGRLGLPSTSLHLALTLCCFPQWFWSRLNKEDRACSVWVHSPHGGRILYQNTLYLEVGIVWAYFHILKLQFCVLVESDFIQNKYVCCFSLHTGQNQPESTFITIECEGFWTSGSVGSGCKTAWGLAWDLPFCGGSIFCPLQLSLYWRNNLYAYIIQNYNQRISVVRERCDIHVAEIAWGHRAHPPGAAFSPWGVVDLGMGPGFSHHVL